MRKRSPENHWRRLVPASLILLLIPAAVTSCLRVSPARDAAVFRVISAIDSLRVSGLYEQALRETGVLRSLTSVSGGRAWHRVEGKYLEETLKRIVALPPDLRLEMATADSLGPVIVRLKDIDENYVAAADAASRQLEIRSRHLGPEHPDVASTLDLLGQIARLAGDGRASMEYLERALAIRRACFGSKHPDVAATLHHMGETCHESRGDTRISNDLQSRLAEKSYREALSILESTVAPDAPDMAPVLQSMGSLYRLWHRFDEAEPLYSRALEIRRLNFGPGSLPVAENLTWLGYCQLCAGRLEAAKKSLTEAQEIYVELGLSHSHAMGNVKLFLADNAWLREDYPAAIALWKESFQCPTNAPANQPQGFGMRRLRGLVPEYIDGLLCAGQTGEAWQEFCRGCGPATRSLLNFRMARRSHDGIDTVDSLRAEVLTLRQRMAALETDSVDPLRQPTPITGDPRDSIRVELSRLDSERGILEQEIVSLVPEDSLSLERIQALLKPDQAMIGWTFARWNWSGESQKHSVWGFVLRRDGDVHWVHLGSWRRTDESLRWFSDETRLERSLVRSSGWPHRVLPDSELNADANRAWEKLFAPMMPHLGGINDVVVVDGWQFWPLKIYPECLRDSRGVPMNELFAFSYTPSPWAYVHLAESARKFGPPEKSIVAMADPLGRAEVPVMASINNGVETLLSDAAGGAGPAAIDPAVFRGAMAGDPEAMSRLPGLPYSRGEARKAASLFPRNSVLVGKDATENSLKRLLARTPHLGVLHLATHALMDVVEPGRSALVIARPGGPEGENPQSPARDDGVITADEVLLGWNLDADLVTLSGCETSQGARSRGGEDLGFAQAFLGAGARSLIMSRWKVDDLATSLFMGRFYENLTGSYREPRRGLVGAAMSKARALQEAQIWLRDLRDAEGRAPFAHPVYWAGFFLIGNSD